MQLVLCWKCWSDLQLYGYWYFVTECLWVRVEARCWGKVFLSMFFVVENGIAVRWDQHFWFLEWFYFTVVGNVDWFLTTVRRTSQSSHLDLGLLDTCLKHKYTNQYKLELSLIVMSIPFFLALSHENKYISIHYFEKRGITL